MNHRQIALLAIAALFSVLLHPRAHGQGTSEQLPEPMTVAEASRYFDHLQLSDQQRRAAERMFGEYRERFAELRDGPMERAMALDASERAQRLPGIMRQVVELDESFVLEIEAILSDDQLPWLDDVRRMRDRARYHSLRNFRTHSSFSFVDLRKALENVELTAEQWKRVQPLLRDHEKQMMALYHTFFQHSANLAGGDEDAGRDLIEAGNRIRTLILRRFYELEQLLEPRQADEFLWQFVLQGYVRTRSIARLGVEAQYAAALELEHITDAQREAIEAAWQTVRQRRQAIHRDAVQVLDEHGRVASDWSMGFGPVQEMQTEIREQARELNDKAVAQLHSMFDEQTIEQLEAVPSRTAIANMMQGGTGMHGLVFTFVQIGLDQPRRRASAPRGDAFIPLPLSEEDVHHVAALLDLDAGRASLLDELHHQYMDRFDEQAQPLIDDAASVRTSPGSLMPNSGEASEEALEYAQEQLELIDRAFRARDTARNAVMDLDARYLRDVAAVLPAESINEVGMERAQLAVQRRVFERGAPSGFGDWPNRASAINLSRMVFEHIEPEQRDALQELLLEYDRAYLAAARQRFDALMQRNRAGEADMHGVALGDTTLDDRFEQYQELQADVRRTHRDVAKVNQRSLAKVLELLPDDTAAHFNHAFNRAAYPLVFDDPLNIINPLFAAFELEGLTSEQRSELGEIAAEYRPVYYELTNQMVDLTAAHYGDIPARMTIGDAEQSRINQQFANDMERLQFQRDEATRKATQRLRHTLTDEQIRRIGGLPAPQ